ncbi:CPBP family intramembrane glutamic endopeptidase [Halorarius litoreus]|uniref:CPBP family intramembrane glutamic endopeptidase n=1 Tax=Halorarius litoreus TaxID=2962676 RepID=UPI0020CBC629|nr:CPBP family intramembrane glutamic endopeptidase [Halorarius litoreus]
MDSSIHAADRPAEPLAFDRGVGPLVGFLLSTTLLATLVPLFVYPNLGPWPSLVAMAAAFAAIGGIAWLALRLDGRRAADVGLSRDDVLPGVLPVAAIYLLINAVAAIAVVLASGSVRLTLPGAVSPSWWVAMAVVQLTFVGITEEFAFRGYVQNKLVAVLGGGTDRVRKVVAILLGVGLFALWHIPQRVFGQGLTEPSEILGTLVVVVVLGLFLGLLYEYTRNVVLVGVLHGTFNWSFVFVAGAPGDLPFLVAIPVFAVLVWYYRRWASEAHAASFRPQVQPQTPRRS